MAESFNLGTFLNNYQQWNDMKFTAAENAVAAMEERDISNARQAVQEVGFLGLTLGEKLKEAGVGPRVLQQLGDTAIGIVNDIVNPFAQWLADNEKYYTEEMFTTEIQGFAKQMFFAKQELSKAASQGAYIVGLSAQDSEGAPAITGTQFSMDM